MYHRISKQIGCPKVGQDPMVVYGKQGFRGLNGCIPVVATIAGRVLLFFGGGDGAQQGSWARIHVVRWLHLSFQLCLPLKRELL